MVHDCKSPSWKKGKGHFSKVAHNIKPHHPPKRAIWSLKTQTSTKSLVNSSMYKILRKAQSDRSSKGIGSGEDVLLFHWNCLNAIKIHKKTATWKCYWDDRQRKCIIKPPVIQHRLHGERCSSSFETLQNNRWMCEATSPQTGTTDAWRRNMNWQKRHCLFVKCQVLDRDEWNSKIKDMEMEIVEMVITK